MSNTQLKPSTCRALPSAGILMLLLVMLLATVAGFAAETPPAVTESQPSVKEALKSHLDYAAKAPMLERERVEKQFIKQYGAALVPELETLNADEGMRARVHEMLSYLAQEGKTDADRKAAVLTLVRHKVKGPRYRGGDDDWYESVRSADFTDEARQMLRESLDSQIARKGTAGPNLLLLIGASGDASQVPKLRDLIPVFDPRVAPAGVEGRSSPFRLHSYPPLLACARLGDKKSIKECIEVMDAMPDDDQRVLNLETLSYVRQPEVVEYIKKFLFSDEKEHQGSRDVIDEPYAARATQALLKMLPDFPYMAPLEERRKWMSEQKQWNMIR